MTEMTIEVLVPRSSVDHGVNFDFNLVDVTIRLVPDNCLGSSPGIRFIDKPVANLNKQNTGTALYHARLRIVADRVEVLSDDQYLRLFAVCVPVEALHARPEPQRILLPLITVGPNEIDSMGVRTTVTEKLCSPSLVVVTFWLQRKCDLCVEPRITLQHLLNLLQESIEFCGRLARGQTSHTTIRRRKTHARHVPVHH